MMKEAWIERIYGVVGAIFLIKALEFLNQGISMLLMSHELGQLCIPPTLPYFCFVIPPMILAILYIRGTRNQTLHVFTLICIVLGFFIVGFMAYMALQRNQSDMIKTTMTMSALRGFLSLCILSGLVIVLLKENKKKKATEEPVLIQ